MAVLTVSVVLQFSSVAAAQSPVTFIKEDTTTKGNWVGAYGNYSHILPCPPVILTEVPIGSTPKVCGRGGGSLIDPTIDYSLPPYNWTPEQIAGIPYYKSSSPYWDEYVSKWPYITYSMIGTYAVLVHGGTQYNVQYPAFEWAWGNAQPTQNDPRSVYYYGNCKSGCDVQPECTDCGYCCSKGWRLACWDDGGERSQPINGYFNVTMYFPQGTFLLSLYAYDYEQNQRASQEYRIYSANGQTQLASHQISGSAFDNGVYAIFKVVAPRGGLTIIIQVYNDAGHVPFDAYPLYSDEHTNNVVLSGIFVDKVGRSWWFWWPW